MAMNLIKMMTQKVGMVAAVVLLWLLDDLAFFLPDSVVWSLTDAFLKIVHFGQASRIEGLREYWTGSRGNPPTTPAS